ncbi:MAG TPA: LPS assembly lipoprotein LptE [Frateuria sp.]|uniref:LPS-assembly lipoprotein LptE n=1 Tax=Frateuria sp. TaxID=2211372 RepID=UPI002D7F3A19|nr:LPS assembly lipoprotein LptE [Frateuria sp.]HET6807020.1 LPS assembly lipoprotein LptE [Frateuria sp.]
MNRLFRVSLLVCTLALSACGFHLRQSAALPASMQRLHLTVGGGGDLQRDLARALEDSGVTLEDEGGPGIAELKIPVAAFGTDTLSVSGGARVTEYTVRYQVRFEVDDSNGQVLVPQQRIDMSRDFSYDALNTVGTEAQVEEIRRSLNDDMVQAILFRLQAAGRHQLAAPAAAASAG